MDMEKILIMGDDDQLKIMEGMTIEQFEINLLENTLNNAHSFYGDKVFDNKLAEFIQGRINNLVLIDGDKP